MSIFIFYIWKCSLFANQGLYNGFLAAGLLLAWAVSSPLFVIFFLACVILRRDFRRGHVTKSDFI